MQSDGCTRFVNSLHKVNKGDRFRARRRFTEWLGNSAPPIRAAAVSRAVQLAGTLAVRQHLLDELPELLQIAMNAIPYESEDIDVKRGTMIDQHALDDATILDAVTASLANPRCSVVQLCWMKLISRIIKQCLAACISPSQSLWQILDCCLAQPPSTSQPVQQFSYYLKLSGLMLRAAATADLLCESDIASVRSAIKRADGVLSAWFSNPGLHDALAGRTITSQADHAGGASAPSTSHPSSDQHDFLVSAMSCDAVLRCHASAEGGRRARGWSDAMVVLLQRTVLNALSSIGFLRLNARIGVDPESSRMLYSSLETLFQCCDRAGWCSEGAVRLFSDVLVHKDTALVQALCLNQTLWTDEFMGPEAIPSAHSRGPPYTPVFTPADQATHSWAQRLMAFHPWRCFSYTLYTMNFDASSVLDFIVTPASDPAYDFLPYLLTTLKQIQAQWRQYTSVMQPMATHQQGPDEQTEAPALFTDTDMEVGAVYSQVDADDISEDGDAEVSLLDATMGCLSQLGELIARPGMERSLGFSPAPLVKAIQAVLTCWEADP